MFLLLTSVFDNYRCMLPHVHLCYSLKQLLNLIKFFGFCWFHICLFFFAIILTIIIKIPIFIHILKQTKFKVVSQLHSPYVSLHFVYWSHWLVLFLYLSFQSFSLTDAEWDEFIQWYYRVIQYVQMFVNMSKFDSSTSFGV